MKPGDLVRIDVPHNPLVHNQLAVLLAIDKSYTHWPNNRIYYEVLMNDGKILAFGYEQLIFEEDLYFTRDDHFAVQNST